MGREAPRGEPCRRRSAQRLWQPETRDVTACCVASYRRHMREYAHWSVMQRWYESIDTGELLATITVKKRGEEVEAQIAKAAKPTVLDDDFPKLVTVENGQPLIKDNPPLIYHQTDLGAEEYERLVKVAFRKYRATLEDRKELLDRFEPRTSP